MVVVGRAQAPPPWEPPPQPKSPPYTPQPTPPQIHPQPPPPPPPRVLADSWGVCRIRTGCSRPPVGPQVGGLRGYVATLPTCGPRLILPPRSEAVGNPQAAGVM